MEAGINEDQNFYSRHPNPQHTENQQHQRNYVPPPLPAYEPKSPRLPPKLPFLTTTNLQTVTANGYCSGTAGGDPDLFYRDYRGVQSSTGYTGNTTNRMSTTASGTRQPPSSLRSNGNGTTPKHPSLSATRTALKPSYRSASSPLDERTEVLSSAKTSSALNGFPKSQQPSVKDLLKRFDENNQQSDPATCKPASRPMPRDNGAMSAGYLRSRTPSENQATVGTSRAGLVTRDTGGVKSPINSRSAQRTRFAKEDQHSNNTLSGVARASRPRNVVSTNGQASKSMTNLSPTSTSHSSSQTPTRRPLFGEVLPTDQGTPDIGYGISGARIRRTSDSSLHANAGNHNRSRSDIDISPSSPTAWYLGVTPALDDVDPNKPSHPIRGHNRAHSDFADTKVNTLNGISQKPLHAPFSEAPKRSSQSRIPLKSKRLSNPSDSSSPPPTRANSPFASKTISNSKLRKPENRPWSPASRAMTPTHKSLGRKTASPEKTTANKASLNTYISAPPTKTSPRLRSSRPRQPVSATATTSSRQKAVNRSGSPQQIRTGMKITRIIGEDDSRSRKIPDAGPVDFAARRARIQRAYTKSIHESEQKEIRAANMRRLTSRREKEVEAGAGKENSGMDKEAEVESPVGPAPEVKGDPVMPLQISTSMFHSPDYTHGRSGLKIDPPSQDSPTLGMPGSFPDEGDSYNDDEPPPSATSNATGTTEIDNEPQTEAPLLSLLPSTNRTDSDMQSNHILGLQDLNLGGSPQESELNYHGDDRGSIQIILDATPVEEPQHDRTPTKDLFALDQPLSGTFLPDADISHEQPILPTTITLASSKNISPERSATVMPPELSSEVHIKDDNAGLFSDEDNLVRQSTHGAQPQVTVHPPTVEELERSPKDAFGNGTPTFELPMLHTALAAPTDCFLQDYLSTPGTDLDYESSDGVGHSNASGQEHLEVSGDDNLDVQSSPQMKRSSQHSAWTDYSVDTADEYSGQEDYNYLPPTSILSETGKISTPPPISVFSEAGKRPTPPPKERSSSPKPDVPPKPMNYSPQPSPLFVAETPRIASPLQLSESNTSDGLGLSLSTRSPRYSSSMTSILLWPDHAPPPVPQQSLDDSSPAKPTRSPPPPSLYNRRPPSSIYRSSHNSTNRDSESRRGSDDLYSPRPSISTPRSSTQISLEDVSSSQQSLDGPAKSGAPESEEDRKAAEKLKKRLFQRRMLIKELIDTESVYLKDMNVVEEIYKGTAEACPKLEGSDVKAIFRNTDEIVAFSTIFLDELKAAGSSVYYPRSQRPRQSRTTTVTSISPATPATEDGFSIASTLNDETDEQKDRKTFIGTNFGKHLKKMQTVYTDFLKNSELASTRLTALQTDAAVKVWLGECNLVAKDLTAAWDLDALLVKPVQRITRYQLLLAQILEHTSDDHPDFPALQVTVREIASLLKNIDDLKKRIHMVGKIVNRKRKESDVRSGLAKAFGRRAEKLQASNANRPHDDELYLKLHEKFGDDYLRLQVVLRDIEFYTRQVTTYVTDFLRYLSSIELVMRLSASHYPELESKWARFNMSMRDMGTVALEDHVTAVRKRIIEPFEHVIQAYGPPGLAMKKRTKRRLDYEKSLQAKAQGKKIDEKLSELVDQYEALNETLKMDLPKLSLMTEKIGNICLVQFVALQAQWYGIWQDKVKVVLEDSQMPKDIEDVVDMFNRDFKYVQGRAQELGIINGTFLDSSSKGRGSQSTRDDDASLKSKGRPSNISSRSRGESLNGDQSPSLPTPDFAKRHSGQFTFSPIVSNAPGLPQSAYRDQLYSNSHSRTGSGTPATPDTSVGSRPHTNSLARPSTGRSYDSNSVPRQSTDYSGPYRRESGSTYNSGTHHVDGPPTSTRPFSGLFHSAMPLPDGPEDSQRSSRASSRDRNVSNGYNVLYLAASLFEFNISATKSEAGYPYLTYQAGEIFDVIGEKGELWLAKNQDDPSDQVGWIWSKHFARLATD